MRFIDLKTVVIDISTPWGPGAAIWSPAALVVASCQRPVLNDALHDFTSIRFFPRRYFGEFALPSIQTGSLRVPFSLMTPLCLSGCWRSPELVKGVWAKCVGATAYTKDDSLRRCSGRNNVCSSLCCVISTKRRGGWDICWPNLRSGHTHTALWPCINSPIFNKMSIIVNNRRHWLLNSTISKYHTQDASQIQTNILQYVLKVWSEVHLWATRMLGGPRLTVITC